MRLLKPAAVRNTIVYNWEKSANEAFVALLANLFLEIQHMMEHLLSWNVHFRGSFELA